MTLRVVPEGLMTTSAAVEALAARLASVHTAVTPSIAAVVPPAADPVSMQAAMSCSTQGSGHVAAAAEGVTELTRAGAAVGQSGASYAIDDLYAAAAYSRQGVY